MYKISVKEWSYYPSDEDISLTSNYILRELTNIVNDINDEDLYDELRRAIEDFTWLSNVTVSGESASDYDAYSWKDFYDEYVNNLYNIASSWKEIVII